MGPIILSIAVGFWFVYRATEIPATAFEFWLHNYLYKGGTDYSLLRMTGMIALIAIITFIILTILHRMPVVHTVLFFGENYILGLLMVNIICDGWPNANPIVVFIISFLIYGFIRMVICEFLNAPDPDNHPVYAPIGMGFLSVLVYSVCCLIMYRVPFMKPFNYKSIPVLIAAVFFVISVIILTKTREEIDTLSGRKNLKELGINKYQYRQIVAEHEAKEKADAERSRLRHNQRVKEELGDQVIGEDKVLFGEAAEKIVELENKRKKKR